MSSWSAFAYSINTSKYRFSENILSMSKKKKNYKVTSGRIHQYLLIHIHNRVSPFSYFPCAIVRMEIYSAKRVRKGKFFLFCINNAPAKKKGGGGPLPPRIYERFKREEKGRAIPEDICTTFSCKSELELNLSRNSTLLRPLHDFLLHLLGQTTSLLSSLTVKMLIEFNYFS